MVSDLRWCCQQVQDYPDLIPAKEWGSFPENDSMRTKWRRNYCDGIIGGEKKDLCEGIIPYRKKIETTNLFKIIDVYQLKIWHNLLLLLRN